MESAGLSTASINTVVKQLKTIAREEHHRDGGRVALMQEAKNRSPPLHTQLLPKNLGRLTGKSGPKRRKFWARAELS